MRPWRSHLTGSTCSPLQAAPAEQLVILRTGPGEKRVLKGEGLVYTSATWIPGSTRILVGGYKPGVPPALYVQDIASSDPRPVVTGTDRSVVSPDGSTVATIDPQGEGNTLTPVAGGSSRAVHGLPPVGLSFYDGRNPGAKIFARAGTVPFKILRLNTETRSADLWRTLGPFDLSGVVGTSGNCYNARRSDRYCYSYIRNLSTLFVASGLK